jgi:hypothetical protein
MVEVEMKKLVLMQSVGNGHEDWDTTYYDESQGAYKQISRQMFFHMKIQEMIFQETQKQKETLSSANSSQLELFHYEDGRSNQGETGQNLPA